MKVIHRHPMSPWAAVMAVLIGCQSPPAADSEPAEPHTERHAEPPRRIAEPPPAAVQASLLPPLDVGLGSRELQSEPRFDIAISDVEARAFFVSLVADTPYNMVVHPRVEGEISLELKDVTVAQALQSVRDVYGYPIRRVEGGFEVKPIAISMRIFQIDYLNVERLGNSETRVSSGQISSSADSSSNSDSGNDSSSQSRTVVSGSQIKTHTDASFWKEITLSLNAIVGSEPGRSVIVSPHTGIAVVRAMPDELEDVEEYLAATQRNLERQVILEAKILEVQLNEGYRAGINWAQLITSGKKSVLLGQTGGGENIRDGTSDIAGESYELDPRVRDLVTTTAASAFGGVFSVAVALDKFSAIIELLETQGEVRTLSNPRISTLNNQKAVIKVGSDEFFVTDISTTTVQGTTTTSNPTVELTPFFSGIALDVTPQVSADGNVILHIHPSVSEVIDQAKAIQLGLGADAHTINLPLAFSTIRETDSVVAAKSGEVIVIGGLMQDLDFDDRIATPGASRIPLLGRLFRQQASGHQKTELVILLRPIVVGAGTWRSQVESIERRIERRGGRSLELSADDPYAARNRIRSP